MPARTSDLALDPDARQRLRAFVEESGSVARAAQLLGVSREPVLRAVSGWPVRRGTLALLCAAMAAHGA